MWLRTGGSDNCALLLAVVATNFPQGSLGFSLLMCVNSLTSRERWKFESQELCNTLYTAHTRTRALLMGVTNSFLKRVLNQLCELLKWTGSDFGFGAFAYLSLGKLVSYLLYTFMKSACCQNVRC